ncbi:unnamed protein product [Urochloa decumbens]|uniref:Protein kinase domain-containing protein n=1 Tax=Urochloa decumbens TaxID=240449 RepID=A0ABC9C4H6_9POAL
MAAGEEPNDALRVRVRVWVWVSERPFGVEPGCYHAAWFNLTCDRSYHPPQLFLGNGSVQVLEIPVPDGTVRINSSQLLYTVDAGASTASGPWGRGLPRGGPFVLSESRSSRALVGCGAQVELRGGVDDSLIASYAAVCPLDSDRRIVVEKRSSACTGVGCCQADIVLGYDFYDIRINKINGRGRRCRCDDGYEGNPYLHDGCQDINECRFPNMYPCYGLCNNRNGSFSCWCPPGYYGNASIPSGCQDINECLSPEAHSCYGICLNLPGTFQCQCPIGTYGNSSRKWGCVAMKNPHAVSGLGIGLGVSGGTSLLLLAFGAPFIIRKLKERKAKKMKEKCFNQNHGLLLQQLLMHKADIGERMIIMLRELEKATDNFDRSRVVGGGGHGVVFKGILDLHVVAIKKSKIIVQREIDEFINEVVVLSQVNHRNVVKLLGCCLETEVPLLVYEFISNGTLYHHLHVEGPISLRRADRIRIALEVARALSYLHSAASMPIFHRDIKSSNILLDDTLTAKVSDFGASRYIPIDQTGVTTAIQGTIGYLDPMYYYTGRLTDKSDVFSYGVLLIELLTRKKPFSYRSDGGDGIISYFVSLLTKGKVFDIIDPQVIEEEDGEVQEVAELAAMCTKLKGEDRPTMRKVEMTLESLLVKKKRVPWNSASRNYGDGEIVAHWMSIEQVSTEGSRQYTIEEETLLSGR